MTDNSKDVKRRLREKVVRHRIEKLREEKRRRPFAERVLEEAQKRPEWIEALAAVERAGPGITVDWKVEPIELGNSESSTTELAASVSFYMPRMISRRVEGEERERFAILYIAEGQRKAKLSSSYPYRSPTVDCFKRALDGAAADVRAKMKTEAKEAKAQARVAQKQVKAAPVKEED